MYSKEPDMTDTKSQPSNSSTFSTTKCETCATAWDLILSVVFILQGLLITYHLPLLLAFGLGGLLVIIYIPYIWVFPVAYIVYYIADYGSEERGGWKWLWLHSKLVKFALTHFNNRVVKTCDLDPARNYIVGSHPHGVNVIGAQTAFAFDVADFGARFPGVSPRLLVNGLYFRVPIMRELSAGSGYISVSRKSLQFTLRQSKGLACCIVVGGMKEMEEEWTSHIALVLKSRKGFVRTAIELGADLVPSFTFGENKLYHRLFDSTYAPSFASKVIQVLAKVFPLQWVNPYLFVYGQAAVLGGWKQMLEREELTVVVGEPIKVKQMDKPSEEEVDRLHEQYVEALKRLYDTYNPIYGDCNVPLVIK